MDNKAKTNGINGPSILNNDNEYIEEIILNIPDSKPVIVEFNIPAKPKIDYQLKMWNKVNKFEEEAWDEGRKGFKTGFESIDKAFDGGIKSGFQIIAADSNIGKTALISQIAIQLASLNKNAYVMDFSLDDAMPDKLSRLVGSTNKVLLNAVKFPLNYRHLPEMLGRRKNGLNKIRRLNTNYMPYDSNDTTFIEEIEKEILEMLMIFETMNINMKPVVFIDNFHDLNTKEKPNLVDKQKYDHIAQWAADLAIRLDIPIICSAELKKLNSSRRPIVDDIRECVKIKYEAKAIILVYNEVHYKGESAEVYFQRSSTKLKQPVLEAHFAKNKISSFKGRLFFEFFPEMAYLSESSEKASKAYLNKVFSS